MDTSRPLLCRARMKQEGETIRHGTRVEIPTIHFFSRPAKPPDQGPHRQDVYSFVAKTR
jgi:hypothetical protein